MYSIVSDIFKLFCFRFRGAERQAEKLLKWRQEREAASSRDDNEVAQERTTTPSPAFVMPPRPKEEPETIRQWREEQAKRLEEKDAREAETMNKLRDEAQQELKDW